MFRVIFSIACLLLVSTGVMAAPRTLIRDSSQICGIKATNAPASRQFNHAATASLPHTGEQRTDILAVPDEFANDLAAITAQAKPHGKIALIASPNTRHTNFGAAPRSASDFADQEIPAQIKLVLAQPAAPPVIRKLCQAQRLA